MESIQSWFAPLMWILGTLTALIAFIRLCKPVWQLLQSPKQLAISLTELQDKITEHFDQTNLRLNGFENDLINLKTHAETSDIVQLNLLRDRIVDGFYRYSLSDDLPDDGYRTLCEMHAAYKAEGGNSYIDSIMAQIHELYRRSVQKKIAET